MILSDQDIARRLENEGDLVIEPIDDPDMQMQPASVDLRLGNEFVVYKLPHVSCIDTREPDEAMEGYTETVTVEAGDGFILHPGEFVLGSTYEWVRIPDDLVARVEGRSSIGRLAVVVHASLPADEEVFLWTPDEGFGFYQIGDIVEEGREVHAVSFDPETLEVATHPVTDHIENPEQHIFRVTLENGRRVHVTRDHNLFTLDEHGELSKVASQEATGQFVMIPQRLPSAPDPETELDLVELLCDHERIIAYTEDGFETADWEGVDPTTREHYAGRGAAPLHRIPNATRTELRDEMTLAFKQRNYRLPVDLQVDTELGWLLGFYVAEGYACRKQLVFTNTKGAYLDRVACWFGRFDATLSWSENEDGADQLTVCSALWSAIFQALAGDGRGKNIPRRAWNWPTNVLDGLLEGLLDGDGHRRDGRATLFTRNRDLADRATYLGTRLGYLTSTYSRERTDQRVGGSPEEPVTAWAVDFYEDAHKRGQSVPNPSALLRELREEAGLTMAEAAAQMGLSSKSSISNVENREYRSVKRSTLRAFRDCYASQGAESPRLDALLEADVRFERVTKVELTERIEPTFDLEVQPDGAEIENFLGGFGGIFLSNTAGFIDPGFEGHITLELSNLGRVAVKLYPGMRISQLVFHDMSSPAERPYGPERGSKYFGQEGPVASKIAEDKTSSGE